MAQQRFWKEDILNSPLQTAFKILRKRGIVCRHDFWCCQTCGYAALDEHIKALEAQGKKVRGCVFYHEQKTKTMLTDNLLYLHFDGNGDIDQVLIGREVVTALRKAGYSKDVIEWDGNPRSCIGIKEVVQEQ